MESAKYSRLDELPEPDYFELDLEKIYQPPPTRFQFIKKWVCRKLPLVVFLALFLVAAVLYIGVETAQHPKLTGIARPEHGQLKELAEVNLSDGPSQVTVDASDAASVESDGDRTQVDVAGSDVNITDDGNSRLDLSDTNSTSSAENVMAGDASDPNTTATSDKPAVQQDNGQVSINDATSADNEPLVPIKATFYSGVEGPKACRGHVMAVVNMPKSEGLAGPTPAQCYNFPNLQSSGCATFKANKADGCVAQVFAEPNCSVYTNTAAFMAEDRPVGGNWHSVRVQCGVPEPDPASLGKPPMVDSISSLVDNDKAKGGK